MKFETRFCTSADGTRIAYAVREGTTPPLLVVHGWATVIGEQPEEAGSARLWPERTLVMYDRRGVGASIHDVDDISLVRQVEDISAIVAALRADTIDVYAFWDGAPIAIAFAAEHSNRVERMALYGPYVRGADIISREALRATMDLARTNWVMLRRSMCTMGGRPGAEVERAMERLRRGVSPEMASRYLELYGTMNVDGYVDRVTAPSLIIYRPHDGAVTWPAVQEVASRMPACRLITSESLEDRDERMRQFLDREDGLEPSTSRVTSTDNRGERSAFRTILFTDIVGHTEMMQRLGDTRGRAILRDHERITREALSANDGTEVKAMGDGFMAWFSSAQQAVECAIALQRAFAARNDTGAEPMLIRAAINAGEPIAEEDDLFGTSVIAAARIYREAAGGEIVASDVVRQLVAGKGFAFTERGDVTLKGLDDAVRLYEVRWRE